MAWTTNTKTSPTRLTALQDSLRKACDLAIKQNLETINNIKKVLEAKKNSIRIVRK